MNISLDFHFFLFPIHALGSKKHLYSFQEKKIIENSSQQNGCNSGMCFPIHGTISDGINIADYPTSYNEYNEVKLFLKVSLFSSLLSAYGLAKLLRSDICSVLLFPSIFFRILKFLCYFGTYGMYTYDKFF